MLNSEYLVVGGNFAENLKTHPFHKGILKLDNQQWIEGSVKVPAGSGAVVNRRKWSPHNVKEVEETVEELLARLEEFCGITDQIRSDTSQILDETIPLIKDKVMEMNHIYAKVDKLEAFVKMVAHHVSSLEEQVLEAEKTHGTFLNTVCKLFPCTTIPSFKNRHHLSAEHSYDLPKLYRTEDFFPMNYRKTPDTSLTPIIHGWKFSFGQIGNTRQLQHHEVRNNQI
nr:breast carcinoma-amplified sequence 4 [Dromaius novaehollandiae]